MRGKTLSALFKHARLLPLACLLALCGAPAARADAIVYSTFDTDAAGWSAVSINNSNVISGTHAVTWNSTDGNPGGHISLVDPQVNSTFFFVAPSVYLGDKSAAYGGTLSYDLRRSAGTTFVGGDVHLVGGATPLTLVFDGATPPTTNWTPFTVPLTAGQWHVGTYTGALATEQQVRAVLSTLTALRIRGEYINGTNETGRLDNVSLNAPPEPTPELASVALMGTGLVGCAFVARRQHRRAKRRRRSRDCRHAYVEPEGLSL